VKPKVVEVKPTKPKRTRKVVEEDEDEPELIEAK
jgi:hypothetical protein